MRLKTLTIKNVLFHKRYYRLTALAVSVTVAVLTGSLVVGNSVRSTLVKIVSDRLGDVETVITTGGSFLNESVIDNAVFDDKARGVLALKGFVSVQGRLIPVNILGVDYYSIPPGRAMTNAVLAEEISVPDIILKFPSEGAVPAGSLFVTDNYAEGLRLKFDGVIDSKDGGNIGLKNEQSLPRNIFVNRNELASVLGLNGSINLMLVDKTVSRSDFESIWNPYVSGVNCYYDNDGFTEIKYDRVFIDDAVVNSIFNGNDNVNRIFTYLADKLQTKNNAIHYSFVAAADNYKGRLLNESEIILSDFAANNLDASIGDSVTLSYFTLGKLKALNQDSVRFKVSEIVPVSEPAADSAFIVDFPGLTDVGRCTDWNSDIPINMNLITKQDEEYWEKYKSAPKAIVPYRAIVARWSNIYGSATALKIPGSNVDLGSLSPEMFGIDISYPREAGFKAARGGTDFGGLFLSLGFFIIVSSVILMIIPLSAMMKERRQEFELLKSLGYDNRRILKILNGESSLIILLSSLTGTVLGLLYTSIVLFLLVTVWKGASHTDVLYLFPDLAAIISGLAAGVLISFIVQRIVIKISIKDKADKAPDISPNNKPIKAISVSIAALIISVWSVVNAESDVYFMITGIILIILSTIWVDFFICKFGSKSNLRFDSLKLIASTLYKNRKQALLSLISLTSGVFIVFSVGLNRKGFSSESQLKFAAGGYDLWCETEIPVYHASYSHGQDFGKNLSNELPSTVEILQLFRYASDDASCLNLNKTERPTVIGINTDALRNSGFEISDCMKTIEKDRIFDVMETEIGSVYPGLIDETVLTWGLMMKIGDTLVYENEKTDRIKIKIIGTLKNSIFQGNVLIDENNFRKIWSNIAGSDLMLVKAAKSDVEKTKTVLRKALNDYGIGIQTVSERLKKFAGVTDTYLSVFMTLGGLGLMLGIFGFIIVVRKNLASRIDQIYILETIGFNRSRIKRILFLENIAIPLCAVIVGYIASLVGAGFPDSGFNTLIVSLLFMAIFVFTILRFVDNEVKKILSTK